jgi:hypothetical protein
MEALVRSLSRRRAPRPGQLDGLKVRIIDDPAASGADVGQALRMLARLMVRGQHANGDVQAIDSAPQSSSALTVSPNPRPDHDTNNEAA